MALEIFRAHLLGPTNMGSFRNADGQVLFGAPRGSVSFQASIPDSDDSMLVQLQSVGHDAAEEKQ